MNKYVNQNKKQIKISQQIDRVVKTHTLSEKRKKQFESVLLNGKKTKQVCEIYHLNKYLNKNALFIYKSDHEKLHADEYNDYYQEKHDANAPDWRKYGKLYEESFIDIENSHNNIKDLIKALSLFGFYIETEKNKHTVLPEKQEIKENEYQPECKDLEKTYRKYCQPNEDLSETKLFDLYEQSTDKELVNNWKDKLRGKCFKN